ncbi:unnamed protein product [Rangifer tarandus platyrhynchus]|uniref:Uncharacterized protein n=2 Tax=Rangifer tarandus platyrhynchus TaxID=3082113 RepID=A0AC59ZYA2_RANTA|nr:unnamed protein product [Rangifer tarandus platyrhynchus]
MTAAQEGTALKPAPAVRPGYQEREKEVKTSFHCLLNQSGREEEKATGDEETEAHRNTEQVEDRDNGGRVSSQSEMEETDTLQLWEISISWYLSIFCWKG